MSKQQIKMRAHERPPVDLAAAIEHLRRRAAASNLQRDPKAVAAWFLRRARLVVGISLDPVATAMTPALRTRSLANAFHRLADLLDQCPPGPLGFDIMTDLAEEMRINAAWRAFRGLDDLLKDRRVTLIGCIVAGAAMTEPIEARVARCERELALQRKRLAARGIRMKPIKVSAKMTTPVVLTSVQATERVRQLYAASFPKVAAEVDAAKLEVAIRAWSNLGGRRKKDASTPPKWEAIAGLMHSAGIRCSATGDIKVEAANIKREFMAHKREARQRIRQMQAQMEPWSVRQK